MKANKTIYIISLLLINYNIYSNISDTIKVVKFETKTGIHNIDSFWNVMQPISLVVPPTLLTITLETKDKNPDIYCILYEPLTRYDTLFLGNNKTINLFNLVGGDYQLNIYNKNDNTKTKLEFNIKPEFWNDWWFSPFVLLVISSILGLLFYSFYLIRLRQQLRLQSVRHELEIKALRAQMNPHFIFNSMNTIDAYILRKKFVEASDCLQKFSKLIRRILENSENQTIGISQEIETLKLYIELEQERFSQSFDYNIEVDAKLINNNYQIPPLLIQPFVENAILHGIRHLTTRKGMITVKLSMENEHLKCEIADNGIGREASKTINSENERNHKSMGLDITMERISTHQAIYGNKMETSVIDLDEGTLVTIMLPLVGSEIY